MRRGRPPAVVAGIAIAVALAASASGLLVTGAAESARSLAAGSIAVTGNVQTALELSVAQLGAMPDQRTVNATFSAGGVPQSHVFTGPRLRDVLAAAVPRFDPAIKNDKLRHYASVTASDGYQALVAYGEFDASFENKEILLAVTQDGASLAAEGPRLVVPGDIAGGRYVSGVTDVVLTKPSAALLEATKPLQATIGTLDGALATKRAELESANGALTAKGAELEAANRSLTQANADIASLTAAARALTIALPATLPTRAQLADAGLSLTLHGPPRRTLRVRVLISAALAKRHRLRSRVIALQNVTLGADGGADPLVRAIAPARTALRRMAGKVALLAEATSGDRRALAAATITR